jgi:squalene cyclase
MTEELEPVEKTAIASWVWDCFYGRDTVEVSFWVRADERPRFIERLMKLMDEEFSNAEKRQRAETEEAG